MNSNKQDTKGTWKKLANAALFSMVMVLFGALFVLIMPPLERGSTTESWFITRCIIWGVVIAAGLFLFVVEYHRCSIYSGRPGLKKTLIFKVVGVGSIVLDSDGLVREIIDEDQWFWRWEWKKSRYSSARIIRPPEQKGNFGLRHEETVGVRRRIFWGYNFSVQTLANDLEALNQLKQAIGDKFAEREFYRWQEVVQCLLAELDQEAILGLEYLAGKGDTSKQEQFKEKMRGMIVPRLEAMGLKLIEDELVFNEDECD